MTQSPTLRRERPFAGALLLLVGACGAAAGATSSREPVGVEAPADQAGPPSVAPGGVAEVPDGAAGGAAERPAFRHCVLHSGSSGRLTVGGVQQEANCALDAECLAMPGQATWDDGFVRLSCRGTACQCVLARALADSAAWVEDFVTDEPCADPETARRLFFERCMIGQELEPETAP